MSARSTLIGRPGLMLGSAMVLAATSLARLQAGRGGVVHAATPPADVRAAGSADAACGQCHGGIVRSYARTPMARASGPAADGMMSGSFVHGPSGIRYSMGITRGVPTLRYARVVDGTGPAVAGSVELRYFVGSNTRGRTFLFSRDGLWFETPVNWYSKRGVWDMAPGFGDAKTMPMTLPATEGCLRCHATGMATPVGAENRFAGAPFREGGIGCSACHGDSTAHAASGGRVAALNPDKLSPIRRDSVCLQCHLEGDVMVTRTPDALRHFLPGDDLSADAVYFVNAKSERTRDRATSQYEALLRSACRRGAGDRLTCTSCHDPHRSPEPAERVAFFRSKCLQCHTGAAMATEHHPEQPDCATCHMQRRETSDIAHEQLTDHDIEVQPRAAAGRSVRLAKSKATPADPATALNAAELLPIGEWPAGARERGIAYAQLAAQGDQVAAVRALSLLREAEFEHMAHALVHASLGYLLQTIGHLSEARAEYLLALRDDPHNALSASNLAALEVQEGNNAGARELLREVVMADPGKTAAALNLALLDCKTGDKQAARAEIQRALVFNPDSAEAQRFLRDGQYGGVSCAVQ